MTPPIEPRPSTQSPVRAVLDTDTYNEIDDQFALAYAALSAASASRPFTRPRSSTTVLEIPRTVWRRASRKLSRCCPGSTAAALALCRKCSKDRAASCRRERPVSSDAAKDLVERAMGLPGPLYVLAIAAITNVASALLLEPRILEKIVVVWLGGQPTGWHTASEFNLRQDLSAAQVIFDSGVPLVHIPCKNVAEHLRVTIPELRHWLGGRNALCDYLVSITSDYMDAHASRSKVIWDIATVAWLRNPGWVPSGSCTARS